MSVDHLVAQPPPPVAEALTDLGEDTVDALLLSIAHGSPEAFVALQARMSGLVRVNVRRVLRDAARCEAVTQATFAEVLANATDFDPHRQSAQTWLLLRAHQHALDGLAGVGDLADAQGMTTDHGALASLT